VIFLDVLDAGWSSDQILKTEERNVAAPIGHIHTADLQVREIDRRRQPWPTRLPLFRSEPGFDDYNSVIGHVGREALKGVNNVRFPEKIPNRAEKAENDIVTLAEVEMTHVGDGKSSANGLRLRESDELGF